MRGSCVILQSGGPTSVINSSLYGAIQQAKKEEKITRILGSLNGIDGIINDNIIDLNQEDEEELKYLLTSPSSALGSSRFKLPENIDNPIYEKILTCFKKYDIRYFFLIGGNDSMDTANKVSHYFENNDYKCNIIGVPKTVDNDLIVTDHTPGFGSAAKYIANVFAEINIDVGCYTKGKVTIVEVMGRNAGWLTASSKLACSVGFGPDLIYLPEVAFDIEIFLNDVKKIYDVKKNCIVAVSEGIRDKNGEYIMNLFGKSNSVDSFGHSQLGGTATVLANLVSSKLGLPTRDIELNLPQRCASHIASLTDIIEAKKCGEKAIKEAILGKSGQMVIMTRSKSEKYKINFKSVNLNLIANQVKEFPSEWIINNNNISDEFIDYCLPLIKGEVKYPYQNGLPRFIKLKKVKA